MAFTKRLDAIIAVGYRINSKKSTEFRIWATKILKEYMSKGFVLNDEKFIKGKGEFVMKGEKSFSNISINWDNLIYGKLHKKTYK